MTVEEWLTENGYTDLKRLDAERWAGIFRFMFTYAIITGRFDDLNCYSDRWCYSGYDEAKAALLEWDGSGEPDGWHRHPTSGRRKREGREYVAY